MNRRSLVLASALGGALFVYAIIFLYPSQLVTEKAEADALPGTFSTPVLVQSPDQTAATFQALGTPTDTRPALSVQKQRSTGDWVTAADFSTGGNGGLRVNMDSGGNTNLSSWTLWNLEKNRWEAQAGTTVGASMIRFLTSGSIEMFVADRKAVKAGDALSFIGALTIAGNGNIGIRRAVPTAALDVAGKAKVDALQLATGAGTGKILVSDGNGNATWQSLPTGALPSSSAASSSSSSSSVAPPIVISSDACLLTLAPDTYAVTGKETNIYFDSIARCARPMNTYAHDIAFSSTNSKQMERFWRYTPATGMAGDVPLTYSVLDLNGNVLGTNTSTVRTAEQNSGAGVVRNVLIIGDSTTSANVYPDELARLFENDPMKITMIGTQGATGKHEGYGGKTYTWFNTSPDSPFVREGVFNASAYLAANNVTLTAQDWVIFNLGINDIFSGVSDADVQARLNKVRGHLDAMINSFTTTVPGVRIAVSLIIPPSANQDAFGTNYGSEQNMYRYRRNRDLLNAFMIQNYKQRTGENIFLLPVNASVDPLYGMQHSTTPANARNNSSVDVMVNAVHPAESGYLQEADSIYSFLKYWK